MLSDRRQIVLRALIEEYIARALPVGCLLYTSSDSGLPSSSNTEVLSSKVNINTASASELTTLDGIGAVSYTHLDVYKRQRSCRSDC